MELPPEFQIIDQYFKKLSGPEALDLTDDAAIVSLNQNEEIVLTMDAMSEGVHFFKNDPADLIARKLLRCNISDIAAMGAKPYGYLLALSLPDQYFNHQWMNLFTKGLAHDQKKYGLSLFGGDTTKNLNNMTLSVTMLGKVRKGQAIRRNTAKPTDGIWVTGTIGDAAMGLLALDGKISTNQYFIDRYHIPQPRIELSLNQIASAAMDISDGLVQDLSHLTRESRVDAVIYTNSIPLSNEAKKFQKNYFQTYITGGDDYELIITIPVNKENKALEESKRVGIKLTKIGYCTEYNNGQVHILDEYDNEIKLGKLGWSHI